MSGANFSRRYSVVAETRRQWSEAKKQAIVAEAERPEVNISAVAAANRQHRSRAARHHRARHAPIPLAASQGRGMIAPFVQDGPVNSAEKVLGQLHYCNGAQAGQMIYKEQSRRSE